MYTNGSKNGLWIEWHENGQKRSEGTYKDGSRDGPWTYWAENGQKRNKLTLAGHTAMVYSVAFSPDGDTIASGSFDNTIRLWDAASGTHKHTLTGHTLGVSSALSRQS